MSAADPLAQLSRQGVSVWLDSVSREGLSGGGLALLAREGRVTGVTSNPSVFEDALEASTAYDQQVRDLAVRGVPAPEAVRLLTAYDIRWACDALRGIYDRTNGLDGRVSIEVDPKFADDSRATMADARALWWLVDRPNAMIKIPATPAGLSAVTQATAEGISVNVTLIFGLGRYEQVMEAYLSGLEQALSAGLDLTAIRSVASFFVSRVDTEVDARLDAIGTADARALRGLAAVASARLVYQRFRAALGSERWHRLAAGAHANPQRPLWASTSVQNPAYPDTLYVTSLIAPDTVSALPKATLDAVAGHGRISADTISDGYDHAARVLEDLAAVGIDHDDVVRVLERDGISAFAAAWARLTERLDRALAEGRS